MINRRNFLKTLGIGLAYACAPVVFLKEKATGWTGIIDGTFSITVDGNSFDIGTLDFSGIGDMDSVSDIISNAAEKHGPVVWKPGEFGHFEFSGGDDG